MKIAIMIDANNLYFTLRMKFGRKLDYSKYLKFVKDIGEIKHANVYGIHVRGQAVDFLTKLKTLGFLPCYQNINERDMGKVKATSRIIVEAIAMMIDYDILVIGSSDKNILPLLEYLKAQNKKVIILAANIPNAIKTAAYKCIEIPSSLLEKQNGNGTAKR